jgi:hypothetical protein
MALSYLNAGKRDDLDKNIADIEERLKWRRRTLSVRYRSGIKAIRGLLHSPKVYLWTLVGGFLLGELFTVQMKGKSRQGHAGGAMRGIGKILGRLCFKIAKNMLVNRFMALTNLIFSHSGGSQMGSKHPRLRGRKPYWTP